MKGTINVSNQDPNTSDVKPSDGFDNLPAPEITFTDPPENGVHQWLFLEALRLRRQGVPEEMCEDAMFTARDTGAWPTYRPPNDHEISSAVADAYKIDPSVRRSHDLNSAQFRYDRTKGWPDYCAPIDVSMDESRAREFLATSQCRSVTDLRERSDRIPESAILHLFGPDDLLCCGLAPNHSRVEAAAEWGRRAARMQLIVPNPMRGVGARNKSGKFSARCRANAGERRYLVVEIDKKCFSKDDQVGILWHLGTDLPLVMVVDSGNKSLHGWFNVQDVDPMELSDWFRGAVILGADHVTWKPEQYVRMPGGTRYDGAGREEARQEILYFNPLNIHP